MSTSKSFFAIVVVLPLHFGLGGCSDPCIDDGVSFKKCGNEPAIDDTDATATVGDTNPTTSTTGNSGTDDGGSDDGPQPLRVCRDLDADSFGDPQNCVTDQGVQPGWVADDRDCDDSHPQTFPGAAEQEGLSCMRDADLDGWGDQSATGTVIAGQDCDDLAAYTHPGAAEQQPQLCAKDQDNDGWGDYQPPAGVDPGFDCNDNDPLIVPTASDGQDCFDPLAVEAGSDQNIERGQSAQLSGLASGGTGQYEWTWLPSSSLQSSTLSNPIASPMVTTAYTVRLRDSTTGVVANDGLTVHVTNVTIDLEDQCQVVDLGIANSTLTPSEWSFSTDGSEACQAVNNLASALVCDLNLNHASFRGKMTVTDTPGGVDDDWIGFVWGVQADPNNYYLFSWKRINQAHDDCGGITFPAGMRIKKIARAGQTLGCLDITGDANTSYSTILARPGDIEGGFQPWIVGEVYSFEIQHRGSMSRIEIFNSQTQSIAAVEISDDAYTNGRFGGFVFSQDHACFSDFTTATLD